MVRKPMQKSMVEWAEELEESAAIAGGAGEMDAAMANMDLAKILREAHQTAQALLAMKGVLDCLRTIIPGGEDKALTVVAHVKRVVGELEEARAAMQEFVDRRERGEIQSRYTYGKFRTLLGKGGS